MGRIGLMLLLILGGLPAAGGAAELYLRDGGIIECLRAEQRAATVYVLVNRYTEIELDNSDVALRKTFKGRKTIGSYPHLRKRAGRSR